MSLHSGSREAAAAGLLAALGAAGLSPEHDSARLADRALAAIADCEKRIATLQARIDYLEGLSMTDELTGLLNRRGFAAQLDRALAAARRSGPHGALLVCDLDGFKEVNDRHGHAVGDAVLRQVTQLLMQQVRRTDAVGRLGGDEFALLLVGASDAGAAQKADGFRRLIATTRFSHGADEIRVGMSIGHSYYTGEESEEALFGRADKAMYADKRHARQAARHGRERPLRLASMAG